MAAVGFVETAQQETHPSLSHRCVDPARGFPVLEDVRHWWEIHEVDSACLRFHFPGVRMPVNVGFHLRSGPDDVEQGYRVFEAEVAS